MKGGVFLYNLSKRFHKSSMTVKELITQLCKLPLRAEVYICGDDNCYLHTKQDGSAVCIDNDALDDYYEDNI